MKRMCFFGFCGIVAWAAAAVAQTPMAAGGAAGAGGGTALQALQKHLAALNDVKTLEGQFVCEKRLMMLDSTLASSGRVWIRKSDGKGGGAGEAAVRFSTEKPYLSELILTDGKVLARSQHETKWTTTTLATRPGLTAVMAQLGGWSTGDPGKLAEMYTVERAAGDQAAVPARPTVESAGGAGGAGGGKAGDAATQADMFRLTPVNKDLAAAVKDIRVAMEKQSSKLMFIEIVTPQGDVTRYWFTDVRLNGQLPADVFKPTAGRVGGSP